MSNSKNPVQPKGYDKEEAWAHEENQKAVEAMHKKREQEEADAAAAEADKDK